MMSRILHEFERPHRDRKPAGARQRTTQKRGRRRATRKRGRGIKKPPVSSE